MRSRLNDESGLAERILVGIVVWAFAAVACLVTILMTANHIDERVAFIRSQVTPIDHNLETVKVLESVNANADNINTAAAPLSGQLDQVIGHTNSIKSEAAGIDDTAKSIESTVHSIDGNVNDIHGSVLSINSLAHSINGTVRDINANAGSITERSTASTTASETCSAWCTAFGATTTPPISGAAWPARTAGSTSSSA